MKNVLGKLRHFWVLNIYSDFPVLLRTKVSLGRPFWVFGMSVIWLVAFIKPKPPYPPARAKDHWHWSLAPLSCFTADYWCFIMEENALNFQVLSAVLLTLVSLLNVAVIYDNSRMLKAGRNLFCLSWEHLSRPIEVLFVPLAGIIWCLYNDLRPCPPIPL